MHIPIVIVGCGGHAAHHVENFKSHFIPVAAWDPNPDAYATFPVDEHAFSLEELLAMEADAVMICSPDEFHLEQIMQSLEAGKHVFCEKPLITPDQEIAQLEAAFDLAAEKGLVLTSCHPRRYDRPIRWLRDRVFPRRDDLGFLSRFGDVVSIMFDFSYHKPANLWKHTRSLLLDHVNHEVDLMSCLFGIEGFSAWKLHDGPDHYAVTGKRDDGIAFFFQGTRHLEASKYPEWCCVRFERGEVLLDMMMGVAYIKDHEKHVTETVPGLSIDYSGRLEGVARDFASAIQGHSRGYLSRADMLMNTEAGIVLQQEGVQRVAIRLHQLR